MKLLRFLLISIFFLFTLTVGAQVQVKGYYRSDGTYVRPHTRASPNRALIKKETICNNGQCQAIASLTAKRCKHCVSNPGDIYCWQHPNAGKSQAKSKSKNSNKTAVEIGYSIYPGYGSGLHTKLGYSSPLDLLLSLDYSYNPKEFSMTRSIISSGDRKQYEYDVYGGLFVGTVIHPFGNISCFMQAGVVSGYRRGVFNYQGRYYNYTERISGSNYTKVVLKTGVIVNISSLMNLSIGYNSFPQSAMYGVYFKF